MARSLQQFRPWKDLFWEVDIESLKSILHWLAGLRARCSSSTRTRRSSSAASRCVCRGWRAGTWRHLMILTTSLVPHLLRPRLSLLSPSLTPTLFRHFPISTSSMPRSWPPLHFMGSGSASVTNLRSDSEEDYRSQWTLKEQSHLLRGHSPRPRSCSPRPSQSPWTRSRTRRAHWRSVHSGGIGGSPAPRRCRHPPWWPSPCPRRTPRRPSGSPPVSCPKCSGISPRRLLWQMSAAPHPLL